MSRNSSVKSQESRMRRLVRRVLVLAVASVPVVGLTHCERVPADADGGADDEEDAGVCRVQQVAEDAGDDAAPNCDKFFRYPCGLPDGITGRGNCFFSLNDCTSLCGGYYLTCEAFGSSCGADGTVVDDKENGVVIECGSCVGIAGRRPDGLRPVVDNLVKGSVVRTRIGAYFAQMSHLEAASVHAFRIMGRELSALGAPSEILVAVERARKDEITHAKITARLAHAHGAAAEKARVARTKARSIESIALENAVEGCVRESFGAILASWQAAHAEDQDVRTAMAAIAVDETRHAALSWHVAEWLETKLDPLARARIDEARIRAVEALNAELVDEPHPTLGRAVGLPPAALQRRLLATLADSLGLAAAA